jgi:hypothetical protein
VSAFALANKECRRVHSPVDELERCSRHPSRPARDRCPRCDQPRCAADAIGFAGGCGACAGVGQVRPAGRLETVVRAGVAGWPVIIAGGWIATQYVYDHIFSLVVPGLVGFAAGLVGCAAARPRDRTALVLSVAVCAAVGILGTALGFHLIEGGRQSVLQPWNVVGAPYLCAGLGAVLAPVLFAPASVSSAPAR